MDSKVKEFKKLFTTGLQGIQAACTIYADAIREDSSRKGEFHDACPEIPASAWSLFELVGVGGLDYRLLWGRGKATRSLRRLPRSTQTELLNNGVVVAEGETSRIVPVENLSSDDIKAVFTSTKVRTLDEQRAFLARAKAAEESRAPDFYVNGPNIVVTRPTTISISTLKRIIKNEK